VAPAAGLENLAVTMIWNEGLSAIIGPPSCRLRRMVYRSGQDVHRRVMLPTTQLVVCTPAPSGTVATRRPMRPPPW